MQLSEGGNLKPLGQLELEYNLIACYVFSMVATKAFYSKQMENNYQTKPWQCLWPPFIDHHLIKELIFLVLEKLSIKELYSILIFKFTNKPS